MSPSPGPQGPESLVGPVADFAAFTALLRDRLDLPLDGAAPEDRLVDDLGLDSVALFGLFVLLEDSAAHELPLELIDSLETLGDVWHWYTTLAAQGNGARPEGAATRTGG